VIQCFPNLYFSVLQDTTTTQFSFTNNLTDYTNVAISWNFGDGTQLAGIAAPTHNFPGYGEYTVCFYATDTISHCMDSVCLQVVVDSCPSYYIEPEQPNYTSTSVIMYTDIEFPGNVIWSFGDGSANDTGAAANAVHVFPAYA